MPGYAPRLAEQRRKSQQMIALWVHRMLGLKQRYGELLSISLEWPRRSDGWNAAMNPVIGHVRRLLPHQHDFDGCAYGLKSSSGALLKKPWRIVTDSPSWGRELSL